MVKSDPTSKPRLLGELSGAVADFGTFVPLVVGILAVRQFDATGVLAGFGLFALAVAAVYRRPIPVQPMKVVAALIIVGAITPGQAMAVGIILGVILTVLAVTRIIDLIARAVPQSVIMGIQVGVGAQLALMGLELVGTSPLFGLAALLLIASLYPTRFRSQSCIAVLVLAISVSLAMAPDRLAAIAFSPALPSIAWPSFDDFRIAALTTALPQLALTLSNAVLATAAIAAVYFPRDGARISATRLAASTGGLNLVLAPFGALPMCHGSGGLVAQYGFGARTWVTPVAFGAFCLVLGIGFGSGARQLLMLIPTGAVGAMLAVAGTEMAFSRRFLEIKPSCRIVVVATGVACIATNIAAGLVIGVVAELIRSAYLRRRSETPRAS